MLGNLNKTHVIIAGIGLGIGALAISTVQTNVEANSSANISVQPATVDASKISTVQKVEAPIKLSSASLSNSSDYRPSEIQLLVNEIVNMLLNEHSHEKHDLAFQVSLKDLRDELNSDYPDKGQEIFERIIRGAFPSLANDILALIDKKDVYDEWLLNNMLELNEISLADQKEALWIKRYEVFGKDDAEQIWTPERDEKLEREESMHTVIGMLNQSKDMAMHDRVYILKSAYDEQYFGTSEDLILDSSGVLSQAIFSMDVVQEELSAMTAEQRQEEINSVRSQLGFDEAQIAWLAERDQEREARWQNGYDYMAERAVIEAKYQDDELEVQLDALRERYFQNEAVTIKKEEELLEFYRFKRPRVYGRN